VPGPDSRNVFKQGDYLARMQVAKKGETDCTEKVFLPPRTHKNIPKRATNLYDFQKLFAELVLNYITRANSLLSICNTSGKILQCKVLVNILLHYSYEIVHLYSYAVCFDISFLTLLLPHVCRTTCWQRRGNSLLIVAKCQEI
jgi:hypothetical protein